MIVLGYESEAQLSRRFGWRRGTGPGQGDGYAPMRLGEKQIADLFRGRRYEDAPNIPPSDERPLPRRSW